MDDRFEAARRALEDATLRGPGHIDPALRQRLAERRDVPEELRTLLDKIERHAYQVTDDDLIAIRDLTAQMREIMLKHGRPRGRLGRIVGSVNPLIPKPGTAYQWLPMEDPAITDAKGKRLRQMLSGLDNVFFNIKSERHSYYQALLSLGDRRVASTIEAAERNGGQWRAAVAETGLDAAFYIFRDRSHDAMLPWDIIDGGMKASFFQAEFDKGLREEWTLPPKRQKENARFLPVL